MVPIFGTELSIPQWLYICILDKRIQSFNKYSLIAYYVPDTVKITIKK